MTALKDNFTSTGHKFFYHQEAMAKLKNGRGQPIVTHLMPTDLCNHGCAFCSVQTREGNVLPLSDMLQYLDILIPYGLKSVIISGGGNPILYKCPKTGDGINQLVGEIHARSLEIGLITNGMPLQRFYWPGIQGRLGWKTMLPTTLDKLTWVRISMSGLDHDENEVFVPDLDREKTTLGFSYVYHDAYDEPLDKNHGQVSTVGDLLTLDRSKLKPTRWAADRIPVLTEQILHYVEKYKPAYVRLLPNCLEPEKIDERCAVLQEMANAIDPDVVFVQYKPPAAPHACLLGYIHPVLNSDSYVYPCDSVVLAVAENNYRHGTSDHRFASPWAICHWSEIGKVYDDPVRSLIKEPGEMCRGCVFTRSNAILEGVWNGTIDPVPPVETPTHANFV